MNEQIQDQFAPHPEATLKEKFDLFKAELINLHNTYIYYFDSRPDMIDPYLYQHRLWYYIKIQICIVEQKEDVCFGFYDYKNIPPQIRDNFFKVFKKRFPKGRATSLRLKDVENRLALT